MVKYLAAFFLILIGTQFLEAQSSSRETSRIRNNHYAVRFAYQNGYVFPTNQFLAGNNVESTPINDFETFSLQFGNQTSGKYDWETLYNYPYWGGGIQLMNFHDPEELGTPVSLFGFFNAPFLRGRKLSLDYNIELGLTFNWKPFNPLNNANNISIGAGRTVHIALGSSLNYRLGSNLDAALGLQLSHFSNGALKKPNYGINTVSPVISLKYRLDSDSLRFDPAALSPFIPRWEWNLFVFGGAKNVIFKDLNIDIIEKYEGVQFPVVGVFAGLNLQISHKTKFGLGFTLDYDGSHNAQVAIEEGDLEIADSPFLDKLQLSLSAGYELVIDRISIVLQPSFYLYRKQIRDRTPNFYQRIGVKYYFKDRYYAGIHLRAFNLHISDFIEWHVGYRFFR
ncbi:MAG: acyloxyacyl hydrolase [Saprospiraceae bacterium]|nr:acyloxyacyl hydrolase [Lewinella sp.]